MGLFWWRDKLAVFYLEFRRNLMTVRIESKTLLPKWASRNEWDATLTKESSVPKIGIKEQSSAKKMMSVKRSDIKHFKSYIFEIAGLIRAMLLDVYIVYSCRSDSNSYNTLLFWSILSWSNCLNEIELEWTYLIILWSMVKILSLPRFFYQTLLNCTFAKLLNAWV